MKEGREREEGMGKIDTGISFPASFPALHCTIRVFRLSETAFYMKVDGHVIAIRRIFPSLR